MTEKILRLPAPAKLNLMLRVVGRRTDGYHLLQTVFQFVSICDFITLKTREDGEVRLLTPLPDVPENCDLTVRAAQTLRQATGCPLGVEIHIEKNIPMGGGLGGGSSDAATVLLGLNKMWETGQSTEQLRHIGLGLGADVPIFVEGHSAWAEGIGEQLTRISLPEPWYVIVCPPCQVSTGEIFNSPELTRDNKIIKIADFLAGSVENHCLPVVVNNYLEIGNAMQDLSRYSQPRLTGTGACVFGVFEDEHQACECREHMAKRWKAYVAQGFNVSPLHKAMQNTIC